MAGRRPKNFRSGDLKEELGILLLKGIAAVANVPRPEDVGIDAVASLLREGPDGLLIAENSFYVQLKSSATREILYVQHEVRWLESLKLPFFIGSVRQDAAAIDLFGAHRLSQAIVEQPYLEITLQLDKPDTHPVVEGTRNIKVGPPLLSWTVQDLANNDFAGHAYTVLKPYIEVEQRNIDYRPIRYLEMLEWETGKPPNVLGQMFTSSHAPSIAKEEKRRVFQTMAPCLLAIFNRAHSECDRATFEMCLAFLNYMRENGVDPDPNRVQEFILANWGQVILGKEKAPRLTSLITDSEPGRHEY